MGHLPAWPESRLPLCTAPLALHSTRLSGLHQHWAATAHEHTYAPERRTDARRLQGGEALVADRNSHAFLIATMGHMALHLLCLM